MYKGPTEPFNVIPFIREYWGQFGRPPRVGSAKNKDLSPKEQRYNEFQDSLHSNLKHLSDATANLDKQNTANKQKEKLQKITDQWAQ